MRGKDYTGNKCSKCEVGKMSITNPIDSKANLKRIKWLMEYAEEQRK